MPYRVTFHWGDEILIEAGDAADAIVVDGETTPFQWADARCSIAKAIPLLLGLWGSDFYGDGEGDLEAAIDQADWEWEEPTKPCTCDCGCEDDATTTDDGGNDVCDACASYVDMGDGETHCSKATDDMSKCPNCHELIDWTGILTGGPGVSNYRLGSCDCGEHVWRNQEAGGSWDWYEFDA